MIYVFTNAGIVAVEGGAAAAAAIRTVGLQIADDLAGVASQVDDAASLLELVRTSFAGNGLDTLKIVGSVAFGGAMAAGIAVGAFPLAGSAAVAIGAGWAAGKLYEWAFNSATKIGQRLGQSAFEMWVEPIDPAIQTGYLTATSTRPPRRDPLAIDLDGDGIETVVVTHTPVLFDHDGDGQATPSGWLSGDDAWLVLDRNGNGRIDNGTELFGTDTIKRDGQFAMSGLDALRELDANGDGMLDAHDDAFAQVQLWQDHNQDGVSQVEEFTKLADHGITAIDVIGAATDIDLGNGNRIAGAALVWRGDGSTTQAVDLVLATETNAFINARLDELVHAMASTAPPSAGQVTLAPDARWTPSSALPSLATPVA